MEYLLQESHQKTAHRFIDRLIGLWVVVPVAVPSHSKSGAFPEYIVLQEVAIVGLAYLFFYFLGTNRLEAHNTHHDPE